MYSETRTEIEIPEKKKKEFSLSHMMKGVCECLYVSVTIRSKHGQWELGLAWGI